MFVLYMEDKIMPWQITFNAKGESFTPSKIVFPFSKANDAGEIGKSGYYKDRPIPYGSIVIEVPKEVPNEERLSYIVNLAQPLIPEIAKVGATDWSLDISRYYLTQCNEEYSANELKLLASMNCPLTYSAYKVTEDEFVELKKMFGGFEEP
jgi:hypothetical protein